MQEPDQYNVAVGDHVIRDARASDIDDIFSLSHLLNTVNLPAHKSELEHVIEISENSFSLKESDSTKRAFLFVLTDEADRVIGTSQIFAKHGTLTCPHLYFQVGNDERYSETLKKYFRHCTLRLCQSFDGPTEIGSLVLDQRFRRSKGKLGRNLSYIRFLFIAMKPEIFSHRILAELLPPLGPNFESALWEAIGRKFTGLDYYEADIISRRNKEFIKTLFPSGEIHVALLPSAAQEVIGQVGRNSKAAAHLLARIGFRYSHRVNPFDGGPHFEAEQENISLIHDAIHGRLGREMHASASQMKLGLCGRFSPKRNSGDRFRAVASPYHYRESENLLDLPAKTKQLLDIDNGDDLSVMDLVSRGE
ncbi:MAG TPA: arginine N-succinyltransferase [Myxococcota bacterium]|nr:arginine N-succinyltransferase [Myxococcota bacterium]